MKCFCLGIGAQKAGTTWLYDVIGRSPAAHLGRHKEYRVWDAVDLPLFRRYRVPLSPMAVRRDPLRFCMQRFPSLYFRYFAALLARPNVALTADVSPGYAGLNHARLTMIRQGFERRSIACRVVFHMREPVDRCASVVRMWKRRVRQGEKPPEPAFLDLHAYCHTAHARLLTGYDRTLAAVERAFDRKVVYVGLFEEMFSAEKISDLFRFLGIHPDSDAVETGGAAAATVRADDPDDADFRAIAPLYRAVYEAVACRLPRAVELWKGYRYL